MLLLVISHPPVSFQFTTKVLHPDLEVTLCPPCVYHLINHKLFGLSCGDSWRSIHSLHNLIMHRRAELALVEHIIHLPSKWELKVICTRVQVPNHHGIEPRVTNHWLLGTILLWDKE
jgi:hypothetical protein